VENAPWISTYSNNLANFNCIRRSRKQKPLEERNARQSTNKSIDLQQNRKVLYNGIPRLSDTQETMNISFLFNETERCSKAKMADNVHGEILDVSANIENFCLIRRRGPEVFDAGIQSVNLSSMAASRPSISLPAYCASSVNN
jgi:hypothetical protein